MTCTLEGSCEVKDAKVVTSAPTISSWVAEDGKVEEEAEVVPPLLHVASSRNGEVWYCSYVQPAGAAAELLGSTWRMHPMRALILSKYLLNPLKCPYFPPHLVKG